MALPPFKLATTLFNALKNHGMKLKNINNQEALVQDLSESLNSQLSILKDPYTDNASTLLALVPQIVEMKIFTAIVTKRLNIDTKGMGQFAKLDAVVKEMEDTGSTSAEDLKDALEWSKEYLTSPEMVEILSNEQASIELPESFDVQSILAVIPKTASAIKGNINQLNGFITLAKDKERDERKKAQQAKRDQKKLGND